jgi:phage baseplate assembly protein W
MKDYALVNVNDEEYFISPMDIEYDGDGDILTIDGTRELDQAILKALFTQYGSNEQHPLYGASFATLIGTKLDRVSAGMFITSEVDRVVNRIAKLSVDNMNLTADQKISSVEDIIIDRDIDDSTRYIISIFMKTESGNNQALQIPIKAF